MNILMFMPLDYMGVLSADLIYETSFLLIESLYIISMFEIIVVHTLSTSSGLALLVHLGIDLMECLFQRLPR